jgi:putative ABC transport system permease protein
MNRLKWIWQDLRYVVRSFSKAPRSILLAVFSLILGIGATTAIFSVVDSALLHPFPYTNADELVLLHIHDMGKADADGRYAFRVEEFIDYRDRNHVFSGVMGATATSVFYTTGDTTDPYDGALVTPNTFELLGVRPSLGRLITEMDGNPSSPSVFVMSDRLWQNRFNRDPKILGTTLTLNGQPRTLVAIMPPRFLLLNADFWIPVSVTPGAPYPYVWTLARLKPGTSLEAAAADVEAIAREEAKIFPKLYPEQFNVTVGTLAERYSRDLRRTIYILWAAVMMLLLIACSNVANLLLVRATGRERELAIRSAMGATRGRLVRQLFLESFVLAGCGALIGSAFAFFTLKWVAVLIPPGTVPREVEIKLSPTALLLTLAVTIFTTLLCGVAPAIYAARRDLHMRLVGTGKGVGGVRHGKFRGFLVISQVALSVLLLAGAGLMMRTFFALQHIELGFTPANVLSARISLPKNRYSTVAEKKVFFQKALQQLNTVPGVVSASVAVSPPLQGSALRSPVEVPGKVHSETWSATLELCSEGYIQTLGMSLLRGRLLSETDIDAGRQVAVVNLKLAQDFFGTDDPIGHTIQFAIPNQAADKPQPSSFEVVGVVADIKNDSLLQPTVPQAFIPYTVTGLANNTILVKTATAPVSMTENVREAVWAIDHTVPRVRVSSLEDSLYESNFAAPRFALILLMAFAGVGLVLSVIGIFTVMEYSVTLETHDIGVRMAIGALPGTVLRMVLLKGLRPILIGIVVGLLASLGLTRFLASQLWGVSASDPWTLSVVVVILILAGMTACLFPALKATRVSPLAALRQE